MLQIFIIAVLTICNSYCLENSKDNQFSFNNLIENFISVDKTIYFLPDNDFIILYSDGLKVTGASRLSKDKSREFHVALSKQLISEDLPENSHYDYYRTRRVDDEDKSFIVKSVAGIFNAEYIFDQNTRVIKYLSEDQDILFLNKKEYSRLNFKGNLNYSELIMRTGGVLGTLSSFIIKDLEKNIVLAVIDNKPYIPVVDKQGSLNKLFDFSGKEVASIKFSKNGNVVKSTGLINAPYCFRGMYREKVSGIYLDENRYYDADLGSFLEFNESNLTEFSQEVEF